MASSVKKEKHVPAVQKEAGLPAALQQRMAVSAGAGLSTKAEDNIVPLIYILQGNSPQVQKRNPSYIEGANAGDIWLRNYSNPIVEGNTGILFQPCFFHKAIVEWIYPRVVGSGGFVAQHPVFDDEDEEAALLRIGAKKVFPDQNKPTRFRWLLPNGNEAVLTRYHSGFVYPEDGGLPVPYVIPMSSTGHAVSRQWMFMMNQKLLDNGDKASSFSCIYRLTTKERSNADGTWSVWEISGSNWVPSLEAYERGEALYKAFATGEKKAEAPQQDQEATEAF